MLFRFILALCSFLLLDVSPSLANTTLSEPCRYDGNGNLSLNMKNCQAVTSPYGDSTSNAATGFPGLRSNVGHIGLTPIDPPFGPCRYIDNSSSNDILVPFNVQTEWNSFLGTKLSGITKVHCAKPFEGENDPLGLFYGVASANPGAGDIDTDTGGPAVDTAPVTVPYWRTGSVWPTGAQDVPGVNEHTFDFQCFRPISESYCYNYGQCSACSAYDDKGNCTATYTYTCCTDMGSICSQSSQSWSETFDIIGTGLDSDSTAPSWSGKSTRIAGTTRPNSFCCGTCVQEGKNCNCDYSSCAVTPTSTPANGVCGSGAGQCSGGLLANLRSDSTTTYWTCSGSNGGNDAQCTAPLTQKGQCGTQQYSCTGGTPANQGDDGSISTWICKGTNGGSDSGSCSSCDNGGTLVTSGQGASCPVNGQCGTDDWSCAAGSPINKSSSNGTNTWQCAGANSGSTSDMCSYASAVNGACNYVPVQAAIEDCNHIDGGGNGGNSHDVCTFAGYANVNGYAAGNACSSGTESGYVNDGYMGRWTCNGSNGGSNASCLINVPQPFCAWYNGSVNFYNGATMDTCGFGGG